MEVFKPRFSIIGWVSSMGIFLLSFSLSLLALKTGKKEFFGSFALFLISSFTLISLFFLIIYPTIKYEFKDKGLTLKCGPFRWQIPYCEVKEVVKTNLRYHPSSMGWKLPGYTIGKIYYEDRGYVTMCSTSMCKDILLIKTEKGLFGVTPKDENAFLKALIQRLE